MKVYSLFEIFLSGLAGANVLVEVGVINSSPSQI